MPNPIRYDQPVTVSWRAPIDMWGFRPILEDGVIYASNRQRGGFYALDACTGKVLWRASTSLTAYPRLTDHTIYVSDYYGVLYAIDRQTGEVHWHYRRNERIYRPVIGRDVVYCWCEDDHVCAIDANSGRELWNVPDIHDARWIETYATALLVLDSKNQLTALDGLGGQILWRFRSETDVGSVTLMDGTIYLGGNGTTLYAIDAATGEELWHHEATSNCGIPTIEEAKVYIGANDGSFQALDARTGTTRWIRVVNGQVSGATLIEGVVFAACGQTLYAMDASTGEEHWQVRVPPWGMALMGGIVKVENDFLCADYAQVHRVNGQTGEIQWSVDAQMGVTAANIGHGAAYLCFAQTVGAVDLIDGKELWRVNIGNHPVNPIVTDTMVYLSSKSGFWAVGNSAQDIWPTSPEIITDLAKNCRLVENATLRSLADKLSDGIYRAGAGDSVSITGGRTSSNGLEWIHVSASSFEGWIPLSAIDPETLSPADELVYVYIPE